MVKILELFGGIGAPRKALVNLGIPIKSIDYVEIDAKAVKSYNAIFANDMEYKPEDICDYNLKPDILIHGSPCQDISIAGKQRGAAKDSNTRSSLMWQTINIINNMGVWKPNIVIWENVKNVLSKLMIDNFNNYLNEMSKLGYTSNFEVLNAMDFGLPQNRNRVFVVSILNGNEFNFNKLERKTPRNIIEFLEDNSQVSDEFLVTQPSVLNVIGHKGIKRASIITDCAYTITERQDRCPAQILSIGNNKYRFLTPKECWMLQGFDESDYNAAAKVSSKRALYKQAGNTIPIPILEAIYKELLNL